MTNNILTLRTAKSVQYVQDIGVPYSEVVARLRRHIQRKCGNCPQNTAAELIGVRSSYLSEVLAGRRVPSPYLLSLIGLKRRKVYVFEEQNTDQQESVA